MPLTNPDGFYFADSTTKMSAAAISAAEASSIQNAFNTYRVEIDERSVAAVPPGVIVRWPKVTSPPDNWFLCDGQAVSRTVYPELFNTTGTFYGAGDGVNTFNLPDLSGDNEYDFIIKYRFSDGLRGVQGPGGDAATLEVGTTTVVNPDVNPSVTNSGDDSDAVFDFDLPRAPDVSVGTVGSLNPDQAPAVTDSGVDGDTVLDFGLPRAADVTIGATTVVNPDQSPTVADTGVDGDVALGFSLPRAADLTLGTVTPVNPDQSPTITDTGVDGDAVYDFDLPRAPDFQVGTVTTVPPGQATITNVGADGDIVLDFEIPKGVDGTGTPVFGQIVKTTPDDISIATQGVYQSTGLTAVLDDENDGIVLGTTDSFAIKNVSGETQRLNIVASYDGFFNQSPQVLGLTLAVNGVADLNTECRATTGTGSLAKLVTAWIIELDDGDEVALFVANHSNTDSIDFRRGRIVASSVTGYGAGVAPGGTTGQVLAKVTGDDFVTGWVTPVSALNDLSDVDLAGIADGDAIVYDQATGKWVPGEGGGGASVTVSTTAPSDPEDGDLWFDSTDGSVYVYYVDVDGDQWVEIGGLSGADELSKLDDVDVTAPNQADILVYDSGTNKWENQPPEVSLGLVIALG